MSIADSVKFNDAGLVPVIAQDAEDGTVLMLAWANREALEETAQTGYGTYFPAPALVFGAKAKRAETVRRLFRFCLTATQTP